MDTGAFIAERFDQSAFNVHVDIFQFGRKGEIAGFDPEQDLIQLRPDRACGFLRDDPRRAQHGGMSFAAHDVMLVKSSVV